MSWIRSTEIELSAQRDRVSGVFSRWDVSRGDTLVPKVRMCRRGFLLLGRKPWGIALRGRSFESGATMTEIQFPIRDIAVLIVELVWRHDIWYPCRL